MENKQYPTVRYVAERLNTISRCLRLDYYWLSKLSQSERIILGHMIIELISHSKTLLHYAHDFPITERNFPRTVDDVIDSDGLPF